jgi:formyltetrahydrofolate-dependent phosphoribosylglycinamide formyltransferase
MFLDKAFGTACDEVVIEERMFGEEASLLAFCDGKTVVPMVAAQDHKRALDGDKGLNTGGMGAYAPASVVTKGLLKVIVRDILQPTVDAMVSEGIPFVGCLYAGLMITSTGPRVIEYNCRFGDPETQVVLPLLDSDFLDILEACASESLHKVDVRWKDAVCVSVVAASGGYPKAYGKGFQIHGLDSDFGEPNSIVFHAGTKLVDGKVVTSGGRVLNMTCVAPSFREAIDGCYNIARKICFDEMFYRRDIAQRSLNRPIKLGVMGSTRGTDLQAILDAITNKTLNAKVELVMSNKKDAYILTRAKDHGCATHLHTISGKTREVFDEEVSEIFEDAGVDLILLIGYMRILSAGFVDRWWGKLLNVHPSLLPKYGGGMDKDVHQAVLDAKETESGCTVHFVTHEVDAGPIAVQLSCAVDPDVDTADTLKARVQELEGRALIQAVQDFQAGNHYFLFLFSPPTHIQLSLLHSR